MNRRMTHRNSKPLSEPQAFSTCGKSWKRDLLIDPAATGVKAA
jgi:hypothetical protein